MQDKMQTLNQMIETYGIYNEAESNMEAKKKRVQPSDSKQKVVTVPVDIGNIYNSLSTDLKTNYNYDVEEDWDTPLLRFFDEVENYKQEIGDPNKGDKKAFVESFLNSEFYQKHLQDFMKVNPGLSYKYADYVMSDVFNKLMFVGAKGITKPTGFDSDGRPKGFELNSIKIPMSNMEYLNMVEKFGKDVGASNDSISNFEESFMELKK